MICYADHLSLHQVNTVATMHSGWSLDEQALLWTHDQRSVCTERARLSNKAPFNKCTMIYIHTVCQCRFSSTFTSSSTRHIHFLRLQDYYIWQVRRLVELRPRSLSDIVLLKHGCTLNCMLLITGTNYAHVPLHSKISYTKLIFITLYNLGSQYWNHVRFNCTFPMLQSHDELKAECNV